ncbi:phosphatidylglycerophosphatase A [Methylobacter luteus]|uniref:phosphatidylglycerophosphatase A n=1 Tax=Methylobacter luteus TaxID=415 RepID=UPI0038B3323D
MVVMRLLLFFMPVTLTFFLMAFLLFQRFDILKRWPIGYFDLKLKNGFGDMFSGRFHAAPCLVFY